MPGLELAELDHKGSEPGVMHESMKREGAIPRRVKSYQDLRTIKAESIV